MLEPKLMDLLVYLAQHAGATVSTDELARDVWAGRAMSEQPVYQGIAQLRKALDDDARHPRYIQTITKKGYRLIAEVRWALHEETPGVRRSGRQPRSLVPVLSLLLAGSYLFLSSSDVSISDERHDVATPGFRSIAVLPFVDMSEGGGQQYLGDGIAEEIIHRLAVAPDLRVVGRTSSFSFRDRNVDLQTIGARLDADVILEGSVRRHDGRLRITAQLVSAADGYRVWSRTFEPVMSEPFDIQDLIAQGVARYLQTGLNDDSLPERSWTRVQGAAESYYLGVFQMEKRRADELDKSLVHLQRAIDLDPQFVLARTALAKAYFLASDARYGNVPDEIAMQEAHASIGVARAMDDSVADVQAVIALLSDDEESARAAILRAIDISPNNASFYHQYANTLIFGSGRDSDIVAAMERAVALDPLSPVFRVTLANAYMRTNRDGEAEPQLLKALEIDPDWHIPYIGIASIEMRRGELARAIGTLQSSLGAEGDGARYSGSAAAMIGYGYLTLGDTATAERWFDRAEQLDGEDWFVANMRIHALLAQDRLADAASLLDRWCAEEPENASAFLLGALYRTVTGDRAEAIRMLEYVVDHPEGNGESQLYVPDFLSWGYSPAVYMAFLYRGRGEADRAEALLDDSERFLLSVQSEAPGSPGAAYVRASIHALRGDDAAAVESLRQATRAGWSKLWFLERDPILLRYRDDPEFRSIAAALADRLNEQRALLDRPGPQSRL